MYLFYHPLRKKNIIPDHIQLKEKLELLPTPEKQWFTKVLEDQLTEIYLYTPKDIDNQTPHTKNEVYVIISGEGIFYNGKDSVSFVQGDILFAAAGSNHRFESFSNDFKTWVIFYSEELITSRNRTDSTSYFLNEFLPMWNRVKEYTLEVAKLMPEENYDYKLIENNRSFKEEIVHIIDNFHFLTSNYLTETGPSYININEETKEALLKRLIEAFDMIEEQAIRIGNNEENLSRKVKFFDNNYYSKERILYLAKDHTTHHRSKMVTLLRLNDITPPDYVGW